MKKFKDYKVGAEKYITFVDSEFYPDYIEMAEMMYKDILVRFYDLVHSSDSSQGLLVKISQEKGPTRIQLLRVFRKYVSPDTSVEMLKVKSKIPNIILEFGDRFRDLEEVKLKLYPRNNPDPAIMALLYEYKDRGQKGYELTDTFFTWFERTFGDEYEIKGPRRAGKDLILSQELEGFPYAAPADFIIYRKADNVPLVVGFARYDSDRGGAQEDDRTGGNRDKITMINEYAEITDLPVKVLFINDGPGLLLGSMWNDYASLEEYGLDNAMVCTLKMVNERITKEWLES
ncbi:hypothetical protein [Bacillus altitudinis]|uniref:hypothetical protein n=1 Tax=Bacillus altitudinis TaxID=293387 RepID=UPI002729A2B0|nr:hypothetical protein [Bacillus altitudinis]WLF29203.1 hypothetical protein Q6357_12310 [Bacillus altitudinis]